MISNLLARAARWSFGKMDIGIYISTSCFGGREGGTHGQMDWPPALTAILVRSNIPQQVNIAAWNALFQAWSARSVVFGVIARCLFTLSRYVSHEAFQSILAHIFFQKWSGTSFIKLTLKELGLRIQLNHMSMKCSNPEPSHKDFVILHTNGIQGIAVDFCGCTQSVPKIRQLLRRGLYPATQENPRTCATFNLLRHMHMLSLTSKIATYDYYRALEKLTNNTGINVPKSKYRSLIRLGTQWRHLKMLKRGGRGHSESGVKGTSEGGLAVQCPSCPRPGINLPEGWADAPEEQK